MLPELQGKVVKLKDTVHCTNYKQEMPNKSRSKLYCTFPSHFNT